MVNRTGLAFPRVPERCQVCAHYMYIHSDQMYICRDYMYIHKDYMYTYRDYICIYSGWTVEAWRPLAVTGARHVPKRRQNVFAQIHEPAFDHHQFKMNKKNTNSENMGPFKINQTPFSTNENKFWPPIIHRLAIIPSILFLKETRVGMWKYGPCPAGQLCWF